MICDMESESDKSYYEEDVDENADVDEDDYDFVSVGQGMRSGPNRARGM